MRLSKIKLAGFKSFVDPTVLNLPTNLVGIVGPNGCGKSNTIDAVRWVMGESSAKHLRGESMEDVIFNGSATRKPVNQASIELIFDNSDGSVGGEYAKYNEIAIRRQVSREGQSHYYLNGTRCRRRDITDIFLGTGLGPRSYAIIEQGMISRLIEAKPQELRVYLEEAAGISKYKERRRETENRMRHTRDNLDRLNDLRDEIGKQLEHLKRQAETAERYKTLKADERQRKAELLVLRLRAFSSELESRQRRIAEMENAVEKSIAELRENEAQVEALRSERHEANESFNQLQAMFYQLGSQISQAEQSIRHQKELQQRQQRDHQEVSQELENLQAEMQKDDTRLAQLVTELESIAEQVEIQTSALEEAQTLLESAETEQTQWQQQYEQASQDAAEPLRLAQVEKARMEQIERQLKHLQERQQRLKPELERLDEGPLISQIQNLSTEVQVQEMAQQEAQATLDQTQDQIESARKKLQIERQKLNQAQQESQQAQGRLASLEALQQAALGKDQREIQSWLEAQGLVDAPRLGERIQVQGPWATAVETVLADFLETVEVQSLEGHTAALSGLDKASISLCEATAAGSSGAPTTLWGQVSAPQSLQGLLDRVRLADSVDDALAQRAFLDTHESVITADGYWFGRHWVRSPQVQDARSGMLARKQEIESLQARLNELEAQVEARQESVEALQTELQALEKQRQEQQIHANAAHRAWAEVSSKLSQTQTRQEQLQQRKTALAEELDDIAQRIEFESTALQEATQRRNEAVASLEGLQARQEEISAERDAHRQRVIEARQAVDTRRNELHQSKLQQQSLTAAERGIRDNLARLKTRAGQLSNRLEAVLQAMQSDDDPVYMLEEQLRGLLEQRVEQETIVAEARDRLQGVDNRLRELEQARHQIDQRHNEQRNELEQVKLASQEIQVRGQTLTEQLDETDFEYEVLNEALPEDAQVRQWEETVEQLGRKIARLGAINLAAIDEYAEQSERKVYLDSQHDDLVGALETLEDAIRKIDKETRDRFKSTFDAVNTKIQEKFPKLFGGGHAHLEMTEDDLLTTGIAILARPPGKRISNIHLMSGGEKALTAVAMVFSIFELNPSPFCMLDEVDAPLDDANVGRFCDLVEEMSKQVQFIFITHNKATMELSQQLIGVTMREPGVSRIVDVNVDEAAIMANG
ncbi:MAG: chromosome segregation protein SMC [Thiotrichales bacterium]